MVPVISPDSPRPICWICGKRPVSKTGVPYKGRQYWSRRCHRCRGKRDAKYRFWENVDKSGDCWNWTGSLYTTGYGRMPIGTSIHTGAHRWSYEHHKGEIPDGMHVCHHCDNQRCVNPDHLWLGTNKDNIEDCVSKDRHTRGERSKQAKLTDEIVIQLRKRHKSGASYLSLARQYGVSPNTIRRAVIRDGWKHVP